MKRFSKNIVNEMIEKYESELNSLVKEAYNGIGFDYDDYLEMNGQMRNNYAIKFFLRSELCNKILDDLVDDNEDEYTVIEAISTEFAMRLEEMIDNAIPYSNHRMVAKKLKNRILNRIAMTKNIDEISSSESTSLMQNFNEYVSDGYVSPTTGDVNIGPEGYFGFQLAGPGVDEPYIYLSEIYHLNKGGNDVTYLNEFRYKINGDTKDSKSEKFEDRKWRDLRSELVGMHTSIIDGGTIIPLPGVTSYAEAKDAVEQRMKEKNENLAG